ncbi:bacteriohemerythrin [Pinisolibacter sp.]|uniref:bacteriohemerythrin n=1 Tax=Pinisolibacter sp. TaxID=2172024 RepID=UPI002FDDE7E6
MSEVLVLGVPEMDADHEKLHAMFERVGSTADADLAALFAEIDAEVRDHFTREEVLIDEAQLPIAHCHKTQHALVLSEFDAARRIVESGDAATVRRLIGEVLAELLAGHVASVDLVTSRFLTGGLAANAFDNLRLPAE